MPGLDRLLLCDASTLRPLRVRPVDEADAAALAAGQLPADALEGLPEGTRLTELRLDRAGATALALVAGPDGLGPLGSEFDRRLDPAQPEPAPAGDPWAPADMLERVMQVIRDRQAGRGLTNPEGKSYVKRLLDKGPPKLREKILEEAGELSDAIEDEPDERVAGEAADLLFHAMVGLVFRDLGLREVALVFESRFGVSGIDEKAARKR